MLAKDFAFSYDFQELTSAWRDVYHIIFGGGGGAAAAATNTVLDILDEFWFTRSNVQNKWETNK